ncbi:hypothetical protein GOP47_0022324 [Adiantum capillus-veneris]|uniref:GCF C-terminal domain-containing protein n=1 Tax=Adiantum capillus-veneris TaxID=13818 RepID=A0A9D4U642_ADICA|nr:hypothetical protein GOP47_0022324 [Adiantum capillus-veneris]
MMKTKNFRRRVDDDGDGEDATQVKPASLHSAKISGKKDKGAAKKPSGPKLLSFAEDEDGSEAISKPVSIKKEKPSLVNFDTDDDSFKPKKKASGFGASQASGPKLSTSKDKPAVHSNFQPQAGEYTKEKLLELQKNTIRLGGAKPPLQENKPLEPVIVLKGQMKPAVSATVEIQTLVTDREVLGANDGKLVASRVKDVSYRVKLDTDDAENRLGLMGIGAGAEGGGVTHIPDAAAIAAAKAKRERLRQAQALPDYIPVGNSDILELRGKPRDAATSERDDSSTDDEGEMQTRIAMMGELPSEKVKAGVFESMEDKIEDRTLPGQKEDDEEDEERRWEEEQLRKGFGKRVDDSSTWPGTTPSVPRQEVLHTESYFSGGLATAPLPSSAWGFSGHNMESMTISQRAEAALSTLYDTLRRTRDTHDWTKAELQKTEDNLSSSLLNISTLENSLTTTGDKYVYMQKLRDYIAVLCDFLKSKAPLIEELEEHMQRLHEERATAISERRLADNADETVEVEAAVNAAVLALNKGASASTAATAAATAASNALAARDGSNLATQVDEFGRDVNLQKRMELKKRAQAREWRRACAAKRRVESAVSNLVDTFNGLQVEGEATSDESESEERAFRSGCADILETADRVFGDAAEEYSQLAIVKEKLESWKRLYSSAYRDAYVSLSAPALFAPYVRLELLKWDPLYGDVDFDSMKWHSFLFDYGMPANGIDVSPDDADVDLVPKLVEKVVLPVLHHEIAHCWDILSSRSTSNAVAAVKVVLNYVPPSSDALQDLLAAVRSLLLKAVEDTEVPSWNHQVMSIVPQAARIAAYRFGTSVRLLKHVSYWKDVLATPLLERLALEDLLCGKILPHLRNLILSPYDAISRTERVVSALSGVWIGPNVATRPKLQPLADFLTSIGRAIEKRKGVSSDDVLGLVRRLIRMLVELSEYDRARALSKTFQLKEAL